MFWGAAGPLGCFAIAGAGPVCEYTDALGWSNHACGGHGARTYDCDHCCGGTLQPCLSNAGATCEAQLAFCSARPLIPSSDCTYCCF